MTKQKLDGSEQRLLPKRWEEFSDVALNLLAQQRDLKSKLSEVEAEIDSLRGGGAGVGDKIRPGTRVLLGEPEAPSSARTSLSHIESARADTLQALELIAARLDEERRRAVPLLIADAKDGEVHLGRAVVEALVVLHSAYRRYRDFHDALSQMGISWPQGSLFLALGDPRSEQSAWAIALRSGIARGYIAVSEVPPDLCDANQKWQQRTIASGKDPVREAELAARPALASGR